MYTKGNTLEKSEIKITLRLEQLIRRDSRTSRARADTSNIESGYKRQITWIRRPGRRGLRVCVTDTQDWYQPKNATYQRRWDDVDMETHPCLHKPHLSLIQHGPFPWRRVTCAIGDHADELQLLHMWNEKNYQNFDFSTRNTSLR